ncbi:AAA family ATPase [Phenylobacterium koreense]|uniref:Adenylate kinase family enzyme n=3 Tax=Phenylobacterium TaxID=20 RepID=A0ABV2EJ26_9CAUL
MPARIHIVGASSSGTTTLGAALAERLPAAHLDSDAFFWEATDPPFATKRPPEERVALMEAAMADAPSWIISGSMMGWGEVFVPRLDLAVFLRVPQEVRMARLLARERARYGQAIEPGGAQHAAHLEFVEWARNYEQPGFPGRSLERHRAWLAALPCPVIEIEGAPSLEDSVRQVLVVLGERR